VAAARSRGSAVRSPREAAAPDPGDRPKVTAQAPKAAAPARGRSSDEQRPFGPGSSQDICLVERGSADAAAPSRGDPARIERRIRPVRARVLNRPRSSRARIGSYARSLVKRSRRPGFREMRAASDRDRPPAPDVHRTHGRSRALPAPKADRRSSTEHGIAQGPRTARAAGRIRAPCRRHRPFWTMRPRHAGTSSRSKGPVPTQSTPTALLANWP